MEKARRLAAGLIVLPLLAAETYVSAQIEDEGRQLRIVTASGKVIRPKLEAEQVAFDKAAIAPDRQAVGWLAMFPNCCTSYPIPLTLIILRGNLTRKFDRMAALPVWRWRFMEGSKRVAFMQETVHGGLGTHYQIRDVVSGRLIAEYTPPERNEGTEPGRPAWVKQVDAGER